jgi:hypothetical protein
MRSQTFFPIVYARDLDTALTFYERPRWLVAFVAEEAAREGAGPPAPLRSPTSA